MFKEEEKFVELIATTILKLHKDPNSEFWLDENNEATDLIAYGENAWNPLNYESSTRDFAKLLHRMNDLGYQCDTTNQGFEGVVKFNELRSNGWAKTASEALLISIIKLAYTIKQK